MERVEQRENALLVEVCNKYECDDLLPYVQHIMSLAAIKETLGVIPAVALDIEWHDLRALVILQEEQGKKMAYDNLEMKKRNNQV